MGCFFIGLNRLGSTPTPTLERVGATPTAEVDYLGGVPIASLIGLSDVPTAVLEHLGGMTVSGSLLCYVGNDTLTISETSLSFTSADVGSQKVLMVQASSAWSAELIDPEGLFEISRDGGLGGVGTRVGITLVNANLHIDDYSAAVVFKSRGLRRTLTLAAEASEATYTPLTYIEATGAQYINTGYVVQEDDVIEMDYIRTSSTSADKALFGASDGTNGIWYSIYGSNAYYRFGHSASDNASGAGNRYRVKLQKGNVDVDGLTEALPFTALPNVPLYLFASNNNNESQWMYCYCKTRGFKITKQTGEVVMELRACKRDSDGKIGMLDIVSGRFFTNQGVGEDFSYGGEAHIQEGYELIEYVTFNNDKIFDTGHYGNENTYIEILFERTDTSGADYLFGTSSGSRMTGYLTSSGYWRYGSGYPTFNTSNKYLNYAYVTPGETTVSGTTRTFSVGSAFNTQWTIPIGGHKPSSGVATPTYQGYIYYFRMRIGDEYVADFLPCKRISDGAEGFWDCVSQTFIESI